MIYVALGIDLAGRKDILGLWISENEGAKFWLGNFTEMKNRGMQDILIACSDNFTGMSEAIYKCYFSKDGASIMYTVHQIRNSLRYVSYKDWKGALVGDLRNLFIQLAQKKKHLPL